jgi:hypothetical protein
MAWAPDYISDEQLKAYERISDENDDAMIAWAITTASRTVDDACSQGHDRQFGKVDAPEERLYAATWSSERRRWMVEVDDFHGAPAVTVDGDTVTGAVALPRNAAQKGRPWEKLVLPSSVSLTGDEVAVTAMWGWAAVPVAVEQATALQAARLLARRNAPFGVAGSPDVGSEMRLLAKADPDVVVALKNYVRRGWRLG